MSGPFIANPVYTDNGVPLGALPTMNINRGPKATPVVIITAAVFENWTFTPNTRKTERPDNFGGPNGFVLVTGQASASGRIQIPTSTTETPKDGDWVSFIRDGKNGATAEIWVLHNIGDTWDFGTYRLVSAQASQAYNQP
jgi:hypothetical protein